MEKSDAQPNSVAQRKVLTVAVTGLLLEKGFQSSDKESIETLTEILQCLMVEMGAQARNYCELAGRVIPLPSDIVTALMNMGITLKGVESFAQRENRHIISPPQQASQQKQLQLLQAGTKQSHPSYIPNYLPALPDPHAYIRTPTHKQPVTEYEAIREKAANQKRDIEKALTKFLAKTSETQSLFDTEDTMFPLIACKPSFPSYVAALNPTDQVFDFEELEYHFLVANRTEDVTTKGNENESGNEDENDDTKSESKDKDNNNKTDSTATDPSSIPIKNSAINNAILNNPNIDNPYLRAATLPKKTKAEPIFMQHTQFN